MAATVVRARPFGGHILAQALRATAQTMPGGWMPASLYALFLRAGDASQPIEYQVESPGDGRDRATRTVSAAQGNRQLASLTIQWQRPGGTFSVSAAADDRPPLPDVQPLPYPAPGVLTDALDLRWVDRPTGRGLWFRPRVPLPPDPVLHTSVALYVSDLWLADTLLRRMGRRFDDHDIRASSLDHAAWFHRPPALDDWVYLESSAPVVGDGRGLIRAHLRSAAGDLFATFFQEASVRMRASRGRRPEH